ncbi:MAG: hypothetical protein DI626_11280, partial [Micavibrio aeruginosavorus]
GGYLPSSIGASMIDPWQTEYGYCAWDHGDKTTTDNVVACGGSTARRLKGAPKSTQIAIAVISAGKDKTFQTTCNAFVDANADGTPDTPLLNKPAGSDDIVLGYTYAEAGKIGGSLWNIKTGEPGTAEIGNRDIEIKGSDGTTAARIGYDAGLGVSGVGDFGAVKSDQVFSKSGGAPVNLNGIVRAQNVTGLAAPVGGAPTAPPSANCILPSGTIVTSGNSITMYTATTSTNCASISQSRTCTNGTLGGSATYQYEACGVPGTYSISTMGITNSTLQSQLIGILGNNNEWTQCDSSSGENYDGCTSYASTILVAQGDGGNTWGIYHNINATNFLNSASWYTSSGFLFTSAPGRIGIYTQSGTTTTSVGPLETYRGRAVGAYYHSSHCWTSTGYWGVGWNLCNGAGGDGSNNWHTPSGVTFKIYGRTTAK